MPDLDDNVDPVEFQEYLSNSINSLRVLAEQTGGIAVVNQNDFDKALKRIDAETSDYYMIGYYSTNPDPLKRTRQIDVKVKRKDVDVWARKSYSIKTGPSEVATSRLVVVALMRPRNVAADDMRRDAPGLLSILVRLGSRCRLATGCRQLPSHPPPRR